MQNTAGKTDEISATRNMDDAYWNRDLSAKIEEEMYYLALNAGYYKTPEEMPSYCWKG